MKKVRNIILNKGNTVFSCQCDQSVYEALQILIDKNIGALVVMEGGKFAGIFSERDYARKVILQGKSSKETHVRDIMTEKVITVTPDDSVDHCMNIMVEKRIRHLPVLDKGELAGVISIGDIVKSIMDDQKATIEQLESYISGS